jgi:hypothetical protein
VDANRGDIRPGDIYEDRSYHPVLCTHVAEDGEVLMGISLIDATSPRSCSVSHCGPIKLTVADVLDARPDFDVYRHRRASSDASEGADPT